MSIVTVTTGVAQVISAGTIPASDPLYIQVTGTALSWGYDPTYLFTASCKMAMIGDSQGVGVGESTGHKPYDILHARYPSATITNYCVTGQNSRTIMPNGSNAYVNVNANITKAVTDGNNIVVVFDTSNDSSPNGAGGVTPLAEWKTNVQTIYNTAITGNVDLVIFVTTLPRGDLSAAQKQQQQDMRDFFIATFGNRMAQCWYQVVNPATGNTLLPTYDSGDTIHLNDAGGLIMTNSIIQQLDYHFAKLAAITTKFELYSSATANGTYVLLSTLYTNGATGSPGTYYKVKAYYTDGTAALSANYSLVAGAPITVNAGATQSLPNGTTSFTLTGSATPSTGNTITSYAWTLVSGPNTPNITTPSAATTTVTGAVAGAYVFKLTVNDTGGVPASANTSVNVASAFQVAKYSFANSSAGIITIAGYNPVTGGGLAASNYGRTWPDTASGSGLTLRHLVTDSTSATAKWGPVYFGTNAGDSNGEQTINDGGGFLPVIGAQNSGWWNYQNPLPAGGQFRIEGAIPGRTYYVDLYGSLSSSFSSLDANPMQGYATGVTPIQFNANGATSRFARLVIVADGSGFLNGVGTSNVAGQSDFGMIDALVITQFN